MSPRSLITCRWCGKDGPPWTLRSIYCSGWCRKQARLASQSASKRRRYHEDADYRLRHLRRIAQAPGRNPESAGSRAFNDRTCPSCKIRHRVPRSLPKLTSVLAVPLDRYQLKSMYALAVEFIDAGGGEAVATDEACEACGRWSIVAFLDWLAPDVEKSA